MAPCPQVSRGPGCMPPWAAASMIALGFDGPGADQHMSQCAAPVTAVKAEGAVISSAPAARSSLYSSGKRRS
jgi:hypothetical protein